MSKILGTHNSITGERAGNILAKLFPCFCKCQNRELLEQASVGVTCFDVRLWFGNDGAWHYGHGLAEYVSYDSDIVNPCCLIEDIHLNHAGNNNGKQLYIRLILEHPYNNGRTLFQNLCKDLEGSFPDIVFFEGRDKYTWEKLFTFKRESEVPEVHEYHASVSGSGLLKCMPRLFWKLQGKEYELQEGINLVDFV